MSWSGLHETAMSRVPWLRAKSLKSKRRPCGRLPSSWSCSVVVGMLVFRGAVVRGPASVVRLFCRVCCCVFCERPCAGLPARCPRCTRINGTHPLGHGHHGRAVWASWDGRAGVGGSIRASPLPCSCSRSPERQYRRGPLRPHRAERLEARPRGPWPFGRLSADISPFAPYSSCR